MIDRRSLLTLLTALLPLGLVGCGDVLKQPYPPKSYFALEPRLPATSATAPVKNDEPATTAIATSRSMAIGAMLIHSLRIAPPYDGLQFIYKIGPSQYETDYYVNWIAPPSSLLTGSLTAWLNRAGRLPVVATGSTLRPDIMLDGEVTCLVIDRTDHAHPKAILESRFFLTRAMRSSEVILLSDTAYSAEVPVTSDTPAGYAAAWGAAYGKVLERLTEDLRKVIGSNP